ncbi:MAG TPA: replicative DNA helicase, partial [Paracoccus sp. (in: a-proteobacteria)]|nr:replicative DNA helicase [Paracoccus sp. (in: a-proteobacteria)]
MNEIRALQPAPTPGDSEEQSVPFSIEAEQQLLGALLTNNDVFDRISQLLKPEHFYEPVHARIYEIASERIRKNALASPVTLKAFLDSDAGLKDLGGPAYLARIAAAAISAYAARDYAQMIREFALRRDLITLGQDISARAASVRVEDDAEEQIKAAEQTLYKLGEQGVAERGFQSFLKAVTGAVDAAAAAFQRDGKLSGIPTGLIDLDRKMGGLNNSDLIILAGRPSMGKTSLATNIAFNIAKAYRQGEKSDGTTGAVEGGVVGFFSLEMSAEQLAARILSEASEVGSHQIRSGDMSEEEFRRFVQAANDLQSCPLYIDDTPALPINQLAARARKLKRTHGLDLIIVDYLQLLKAASAKDSRVNEVSEITQGLKAIAKELNIPVIALSQLSRQVESRDDKRPQLSDLRESGSIEQDADIVM